MLDADTLNAGRGRITQVFRYLQALNEMRNPAKRQVKEQPWVLWLGDLPEHPSIRRGAFEEPTVDAGNGPVGDDDVSTAGDDFVLRVQRPTLTPPPNPPDLLRPWLLPGWNVADGSLGVRTTLDEPGADGPPRDVQFGEDATRSHLLEAYRPIWQRWADEERPAYESFRVFERIYELHAQMGREAERLELVLGDGLLVWKREDGDIRHPILLQRLQLDFDPSVPEFVVSESDRPVEIYTALFRPLSDVEGCHIRAALEYMESASVHPLGGDTTSEFLRDFVHRISPSHGKFVEDGEPDGSDRGPAVGRSPVLFLRTRSLGFATALEAIIEDIPARTALPHSLLGIVGIEPPPSEGDLEPSAVRDGEWSEDVLLSKEANKEQVEIAQRLARHGCVLVQGPPGTGKTHTIANLIGHLLAQGKSILVTSHTAKALRVLRDKVVPALQPLCVSVLESDAQSRSELEASVTGIVERLSSDDAQRLDCQAAALTTERACLIARLADAHKRLLNARSDEYREVVVAGDAFSPVEAARRVAVGQGVHDWIPGPVAAGIPLPLSVGELPGLYRTNATVGRDEEHELGCPLPNPDDMVGAQAFEDLVAESARLSAVDIQFRADLWQEANGTLVSPEALEELLEQLAHAIAPLEDDEAWLLAVFAAGAQDQALSQPWATLLEMIGAATHMAALAEDTVLRHRPVLAPDMRPQEQSEVAAQAIAHLESGKKLGWLTLVFEKRWRHIIDRATVSGRPPAKTEHFRAIQTLAELSHAREELSARWDAQVGSLGGPATAEFGEHVERVCAQFIPLIRNALEWHSQVWAPAQERLCQYGFLWDALEREMYPRTRQYGALLQLRDTVRGPLPQILAAQAQRLRKARNEKALSELADLISAAANGDSIADVVVELRDAVTSRGVTAYRGALERLRELHRKRADLEHRRSALDRLDAVAPAWAGAIRDRLAPHGGHRTPGDPTEAWLWRQLQQELEARGRVQLDRIQQEIKRLDEQLRTTTADLVDRRSWAAQLKRNELPQQQALQGWRLLIQKRGRGTGKRAPRLAAAARRLMVECQSAVPVWIMPLSRAVESFDPRRTRFDVVIVDEASQSDVMGLIALYMAEDVVVVGDDQQVSPDAVGQSDADVKHLIDAHLDGVPVADAYDGQTSVYNLAMTCFPGVVCLREHFRCVTPIIQFSNHLSYNGKIQPLRDESKVLTIPSVVPYRVEGASADGKVNQDEALAVASLLLAATEQPEYEGKTFGVISLVGLEQAHRIEQILLRRLDPAEKEGRRIHCGNAAQFQGDERHVVFLSMVDAPGDGPLALRAAGARDMYKKRFNVAASRAQDQLWVIHSLNHRSDLQAGDLRRRLIEHALDPMVLVRALETGEDRVESEFERQVRAQLVVAGYRVISQWSVGYYRIDLVVEGAGKRLAVECDGDRYHPLERLADDMERQAVLERLGWTFVRIRGSQFFRDPDEAMRPVFERLESLGIPPEGTQPADDGQTAGTPELLDRIIRRAANLRVEWEADGGCQYGAGAGPTRKGSTQRLRPGTRVLASGRLGTVLRTPFGRPTVQLDDGGTVTVKRASVEIALSEPQPAESEGDGRRPGQRRAQDRTKLSPATTTRGVDRPGPGGDTRVPKRGPGTEEARQMNRSQNVLALFDEDEDGDGDGDGSELA